jgi:hypothetical protein
MPGASSTSRAKKKRSVRAKPVRGKRSTMSARKSSRTSLSRHKQKPLKKKAVSSSARSPRKAAPKARGAGAKKTRVAKAPSRLAHAAGKGLGGLKKSTGRLTPPGQKTPAPHAVTRPLAASPAKGEPVAASGKRGVQETAALALKGRDRSHRKNAKGGAAGGAASRRKNAERRAKISATTDWEELMAMADLEEVRPYHMQENYAKGEVIRHKVFGLGIVVREIQPQKIQVSFKDGVRLLACNWR